MHSHYSFLHFPLHYKCLFQNTNLQKLYPLNSVCVQILPNLVLKFSFALNKNILGHLRSLADSAHGFVRPIFFITIHNQSKMIFTCGICIISQLPPVFNMPKSQLQCYAESVYCTSSDLLSNLNSGKTPLDRLILVVAWSISTIRPLRFGVTPYNPTLGETHHVSKGNLNVLLEQVLSN